MPFIPKVEEKEEEIEDGTEKLIEYDQPERALNSYPVFVYFSNFLVLLRLENGTKYYAGEKIKGYVEYKSETDQKPVLVFKGYRIVTFQSSSTLFYSKVYFLNHKMMCGESPCSFGIDIPFCSSFGNWSLKTDTSSGMFKRYFNIDATIHTKFQLSVHMVAKKSLFSLYGLLPFSTKIPLTIYPQPLYQNHKDDQKEFKYSNRDEKYDGYRFSCVFYTQVFTPGEKQKVVIRWRNPTGSKEYHEKWVLKFHVELTRKLSIDMKCPPKGEDLKDYEKIQIRHGKKRIHLKDIVLGTVTNEIKGEFGDITAFYYIPRDLCMNELNFEDYYMEYGIKITGSLFDYQIKGPSIEHPIVVTSPMPSKERLEEMFSSKVDKYQETRFYDDVIGEGGIGSFSL